MIDSYQAVEKIGLQPGERVADLGSGTGYFTFSSAFFVGGTGAVFAVDVQKNMLEEVRRQSKKRYVPSVHVLHGDIETKGGTRLSDSSMDAVIVANTLFQVGDRAGVAREGARISKPFARLLFIDWSGSHAGIGPRSDYVIDPSHVEDIFALVGFEVQYKPKIGNFHYGLVMIHKT